MRRRCNNANSNDYKDYGGRGISVCAKWDIFEGFLEDMGESPSDLELDRIDNNGNYTKENCRWITHKEQCNNRRKPKITKEVIRKCRWCGKIFKACNSRAIYCDALCRARNNGIGLTYRKTCLNCGMIFVTRTKKKIYCDNKCKSTLNGKKRTQNRIDALK